MVINTGWIIKELRNSLDIDWLNTGRTIFATIHGSNSYGLSTEYSDIDVAGITIPPREYFYGFLHKFEQKQLKEPFDGAIYGILKYFQLAAENNPNVLELLWIDPKFWLCTNTQFNSLLENRHLFLSTKCKHTYSGYAIAQLKRIKTHKKWLLNPPTHRPSREEFGLPERREISRDQQGALEAANISTNFMEYLQKENKYDGAVKEWDQYNNWKATRNDKRAELEAKFGYDTKHAMHLVRLLRQCREILETGTINVLRSDREELLAIRNGAWEYEKLIEWAEQQDVELEEVAKTSKLPKTPDRVALDKVCVDMVGSLNG